MFLTPACIGGSCAVNSSFPGINHAGPLFLRTPREEFSLLFIRVKTHLHVIKGEIHCLAHILSRCLLPAKSLSTSLTFRI